MKVGALIKEASFSLSGHIILFQVTWAVPVALVFVWTDYTNGILSVSRTAYIIFLASLGALLGAILVWVTITRPLIRSRRNGRRIS